MKDVYYLEREKASIDESLTDRTSGRAVR